MHILQRVLRVQFVKNLLGAAAGVMVAMVVYGVFQVGSTVLASVAAGQELQVDAHNPIHTDTDAYRRFVDSVNGMQSR